MLEECAADRWREPMLAELTSAAFAALLAGPKPVVVLVPVGSVEPHGPHLPLETDTQISLAAAADARRKLEPHVAALIAPPVAYGVTQYASAFAGAVSIPAEVLTAYLRALASSLLRNGVAHVCFVNNHLEPEHDTAVRQAVAGLEPSRASVASPLEKRWARTLSDEFKSGACHAGRYETSILLARAPSLVNEAARAELDEVPISLSQKIREGVRDFIAMGLVHGYAGAPREATAEEGRLLIDALGTMVATVVLEALGKAPEEPLRARRS